MLENYQQYNLDFVDDSNLQWYLGIVCSIVMVSLFAKDQTRKCNIFVHILYGTIPLKGSKITNYVLLCEPVSSITIY